MRTPSLATTLPALLLAWAACTGEADPTAADGTVVAPPHDSIRLVLEGMYDTDQAARQRLFDADDPPAAIAAMHAVDSANQTRLGEILDSYGYPRRSRLGQKAADAAFLVLQHDMRSERMARYVDTLEALAADGEANPVHAAMMRDRVLMNAGRRQRYGSQAYQPIHPDFPDSMFIWPLEPGDVNARRAAAGFGQTVEDNAEGIGAGYDPALQLPARE